MGDKSRKRRPGREADRSRPQECVTFAAGPMWVSICLRSGAAWSKGGEQIPPANRDGVTAAVLVLMAKYQVEPETADDVIDLHRLLFPAETT